MATLWTWLSWLLGGSDNVGADNCEPWEYGCLIAEDDWETAAADG